MQFGTMTFNIYQTSMGYFKKNFLPDGIKERSHFGTDDLEPMCDFLHSVNSS